MKGETVCLISLGCPKNLIDSEVMVGLLVQGGYGVTTRPAEADILLINTCTFIREATRESLDTILEAVELKKSGSCRRLIVAGCLAQRYGPELAPKIREVDLFLGTEEIPRLVAYLEGMPQQPERVAIGRTSFIYDHTTPRLLSGPLHTAYVKIAEGCSRLCSFCIIPSLRGRFRSRPMGSICQEASLLADQGVKEINLVAQDTTSYGHDLQDGSHLAALLEDLCQIEGLRWIRLLYAYPEHLDSNLLRRMAASEKICPYIDLPLQHVNRRILRAMARPGSRRSWETLITKIRDEIPGVCLRTTLMVGFPGETDEDFVELVDFVERNRFERLGVFQFSPEEGTPAARMAKQVPRHIKEKRFRRIMEVQQGISLEHQTRLIGRRVAVLVDESPGEDGTVKGRMATQAPEIDGEVTMVGGRVSPGDMVDVRITKADPYDLEGDILGEALLPGSP